MNRARNAKELAASLAAELKADAPWEVAAERSTRYEVHLQGTAIELERGPLSVEGYGIRLFRARGETLGAGFVASTDLSGPGIANARREAEETARHNEFPSRAVQLPSGGGGAPPVPVADPKLEAEPAQALRAYVDALVQAFDGRKETTLSFGSVKATLSELSFVNSAGLAVSYPSTYVEFEAAVKASGGPEGRPPGEFWVTETARRLEPETLPASVAEWCRYAADVRRAVPPPTGELPVILPTDVLAGILLPVVDARCTGAARLRKIAPEVGSLVAAESITVRDEGDFPWSPGSSPYDDEGAPRAKLPLIERGRLRSLLYDALHASAFGIETTRSGSRAGIGPAGALRCTQAPAPASSTLVVDAGSGGALAELAEQAGEGVLVTQFGWARPDPISSAFGGEIRIGYRVRAGKLAEPVRGGTVGGVVFAPPGSPSMLASVAAVGRASSRYDRLVSPPLLVRPLTVAGA